MAEPIGLPRTQAQTEMEDAQEAGLRARATDCRCGSFQAHVEWWDEAIRVAREQGHPYPVVEAHRRHWERTRG